MVDDLLFCSKLKYLYILLRGCFTDSEFYMDAEIIKSAAGSSVLGKAYDDLLHPSAKSIGNTVSLVPRTIGVWLRGWERWVVNGEESVRLTIDAVGKRADDIPEEHLVEPPAHIAVPVIQQLAYCYDSAELRKMYANLLISSMDDRTADYVHPSFAQILKEISPDEAKLLSTLTNQDSDDRKTIPLLDLRSVPSDTLLPLKWVTILEGYNECCIGVCEHPELSLVYLGNLERLGILERCAHYSEEDKTIFEKYEASSVVRSAMEETELDKDMKFEFRRWSYQVTDFGANFIKTCVA